MAGTIFADRFRLIDVLGTGSNGPVWRAHDANHDRQVALKRFAPGQPNNVAYAEAAMLTLLESDHILRVYNTDTFADVPYIATKVAPSTAEAELSRAHAGLPPDVVLTWARHLLVGLRVCHDFGLVHRDVKPANVFLDEKGRALLGDLGLARLATDTGVPIAGTPRVRAPELFLAGNATKVSDVYAVGVTLYRLLTGAWPFDTERQVLKGEFVRLADAAPHVARRLADRVEKAFALEPTRRFQSAADMNAALGVPGLLPRVWIPVEPHAGHHQCWEERRAGRPGIDLCVLDSGTTFALDVRRATTTRPRVASLCVSEIGAKRLPKTLRDTFGALTRTGT